MKNLDEIRSEIDSIDDKLVELFLNRMDLCGEVAKNKIQTNKNVQDTSREDAILYRLSKKVPENMQFYLKELYSTLFTLSKSYQGVLINKTSKTVDKIKEVIDSGMTAFPISSSVACQGVAGANSGSAAKKVFPICDISYFKNFEGVFSAVANGLCDYGVLPIENSTAGSVLEVYDLMTKYNFYIVRSVRVKINHCLATVNGGDIKSVKKVISHAQALSQCNEYVKKLGVEVESVENTAISAKKVLEANDSSLACLCSKECAELYGLKILEESVQDNKNNYTRFIVISKDLKIYEGNDKISVMTAASNEIGSLSKILTRFASLGLSLTKIESRPIVGTDFEVLFYFDFEGSVKDNGVLNLISELENGSLKFKFLGTYKELI